MEVPPRGGGNSIFPPSLNSNAYKHRCAALRHDFAICGPVPVELSEVFIPKDKLNEEMGYDLQCFPTKFRYGSGPQIEACALSKKESHLHLQSIGKEFLSSMIHTPGGFTPHTRANLRD
jgi:hypothetical protein